MSDKKADINGILPEIIPKRIFALAGVLHMRISSQSQKTPFGPRYSLSSKESFLHSFA